VCLVSSPLWADQFHYHNLVVGERAMGLGGAFCAVADDASGLIYNPAGIAFALSNDITGSANAFYRKTITYKKTIGNGDFVERSGGTLAPFFGGLQKMDSTIPGMAVAFGLYSIDSELKDQDDLIVDVGGLERFHRTANIRSATTGLGMAAAKRVLPNLSLGLSLSYLMIDELVQEYQDVQYKNGIFLTQNYRTQLTGGALELGLGTQYAFGTWSFGLNVRLRSLQNDGYQVGLDLRTNNNGNGGAGENRRTQTKIEVDDALGAIPTEVRMGTAWFPSATFLWTFDVIHHTAAKSDVLELFNRGAVTNFATGAEYYITPSIPVRAGIFTNYDTRPEVVTGKLGQQDHIDYMGYSLFFGWVQPNSQVAGGVVLQSGEGKAQKIQGSAIQTVEAQSYTFAISATHSF
jgi:long-chain fatty acid transport protein